MHSIHPYKLHKGNLLCHAVPVQTKTTKKRISFYIFIDKVLHTVNYKNRQRYLLRHQKHQPTCIPPLFKCIPPPQYKLLKQIVLQNYAQLHFISPRFIALRHPTLQSLLVRAKFNPTVEQLMDISLCIETPTNTHTENAQLPHLSRNHPTTTACKHSHCVTCKYHPLHNPTFHSTNPGNCTIYRIRHSLTCTSTNIIYLITCTKSNKQYIGCTTKQLNTRINRHCTNIVNKIHTPTSCVCVCGSLISQISQNWNRS